MSVRCTRAVIISGLNRMYRFLPAALAAYIATSARRSSSDAATASSS